MANNYDFSISQGCSYNVVLNVTDSLGNPINLSGYNAIGLVKSQHGDTGYILNLNPVPTQPLYSGILTISGTVQQTLPLPIGQFLYDVIAISGGYGLKVLYGNFNINPSTSQGS